MNYRTYTCILNKAALSFIPTNLDMNKQIKKTPLNCKNTPVYNKIHSDVIPLWL